MVAVNEVGLSFGGFELFSNISFNIQQKDRIGLVGKNGAGKSTLLKIIAGQLTCDRGIITMPSDFKIAYLPQQLAVHNQYTVMEATMQAFDDIISIENQLNTLNRELAEWTDFQSTHYQKLIDRITELNHLFAMRDGAHAQIKAEKTLIGLGFKSSDFNRPTSTFSGGWRMRIELAKILLQPSDLLLLDEPTNHLDIDSIEWLENYLQEYNGAVIVVSHDRKFLDNVTNRTLELTLGKIFDYKANFSKFEEIKAERRTQQMAAFQNQQKLIKDTQDFIERFRYKPTKSSQVQSRIKLLDRMEKIEIEPEEDNAIYIQFPVPVKPGRIVLELQDVGKSFGDHVVLEHVNILIERDSRIAFVGSNGEGKSTLSKIIVGELKHDGVVKYGHNVKIGYFAQNQDELLDENLTVFETIDNIAVGDIRTKIRDILGAFLFRGDDIYKKVKVLSGGERSRLAIAKLLFEPYNLLVLDEPTNHLDIRSKDILKQALLKYQGTLIIVSHDRDFMNGLTNRIFEFKNKGVHEFVGGIYEFLQNRKLSSLTELEKKIQIPVDKTSKENFAYKTNYHGKKEIDREIRRIARLIDDSEKQIEQLESQIREMDVKLSNPEGKKIDFDEDFFISYQNFKDSLAKELDKWEKLNLELETFQKQKEHFLQNN
jgi:ATP-binding cassette subfamily F protein 3